MHSLCTLYMYINHLAALYYYFYRNWSIAYVLYRPVAVIVLFKSGVERNSRRRWTKIFHLNFTTTKMSSCDRSTCPLYTYNHHRIVSFCTCSRYCDYYIFLPSSSFRSIPSSASPCLYYFDQIYIRARSAYMFAGVFELKNTHRIAAGCRHNLLSSSRLHFSETRQKSLQIHHSHHTW